MALPAEALTRALIVVRDLYELSVIQSGESEVRRATSILTFHDAVEMFLVLALQHRNAYSARRVYQFAEYWSELAKAGVNLSQQSAMESLNRVRVNLKHHAIMPSPRAINDAVVYVRDFFAENTPTVFGIAFDDISLVSAIAAVFDATRKRLHSAERLIGLGSYDEAVAEIAVAFAILLDDFDNALRARGGVRVFVSNALVRVPHYFERPSAWPEVEHEPHTQDHELRRFAHEVTRAVNDLYGAVKVMSVGLDFRRYAQFKTLTPAVFRAGPSYEAAKRSIPGTLEACRFCLDFVVDSALRLQATAVP